MRARFLVVSFCGIAIAHFILSYVFDVSRYISSGVALLCLLFLYKKAHFTLKTIGITAPTKRSLSWGAGTFLGIATVLTATFFVQEAVFEDTRYNQSLSSLLFALFVSLPITTVLLEELSFRGIVLGGLQARLTQKSALIISSLLFGLWHIPSAQAISIDSFLFITNPSPILITIAVVGATTIAGAFFGLLRIRSGSLATPIIAHWCINGLSMIFAWLAWQS